MIREEHFRFASSQGEIHCHGMRWIPEGEVKAILQIVHGMAEHIERYREFAVYMAEQGFLVTGHDHLGHGLTAPSEEEYGYFADKDGNKCMIRDIHRLQKLTREAWQGVPYVILGHSMGSFLTRQYLCVYGRELDGAVICGTGYQPAAVVKLGMAVCTALAKVHGWHYRSALVDRIACGSYNDGFQPVRTSADWLSRDEMMVDQFIADPKCGFIFTLNGYYNMFLGMSTIIRREYLERMPKDLPVFFIAGDRDPVGNCGKGVKKAEKLFRSHGMKNVECKLYPDDRHEILNELDRKTVYRDILEWIRRSVLLQNTV